MSEQELDHLDEAEIEHFVESRAWRILYQRLRQCEQDKLKQLRSDLDPIETAKVRGFLAGLDFAMHLPEYLMAELRGK